MTNSGAPRGWIDGLAAALGNTEEGGKAEAEAFAERCPTSYFERTSPEVAAVDLHELDRLAATGPRQEGDPHPPYRMAVQPDPDVASGMFRFRMFTNDGVELSAFMPVLESFGLIVVEAVPHRIASAGADRPAVHLDDFGLRVDGKAVFDPTEPVQSERLVSAIEASWAGLAEVDSLNRLVVHAEIDWRDIIVLRAYRRYRRQAGTSWTDRQLDDALVTFPEVTRALLDYFAVRFNPERAGDGDAIEAARQAVLNAARSVERLEHDQVLRGFLGLIDATLRTSHYQRDASGRPWDTLTLKLDSATVPDLPPPRPHVETFVYSAHTEGLHLRGGAIARGGIRWSDRQDDLRTEILGLVRAQVLKNAGIVPTGAKGGFVCKRAKAAGSMAAAVRTGYATFMRGLLDVTDNVVGGRVVPPSSVRPADGEDPYLVVAADRGTAQLSDLANAISAEYRFWLGDAFASGGSHGYDHKAMGITARGVWVAVRQHFQELAIDVQREPIRVVGIGDMSGDVFGNGMLQSEAIKLVAAFDHRDVFIDPDPDPARSYAERRRLFDLAASSWQDYDRTLLSPGGGVWPRSTKSIELDPAACAALGLPGAEGDPATGTSTRALSPPEVIRAILTAPCDLLYVGGIGTFIKATSESHDDAGDHADDQLRVDADRVRARVIAEGGNLGLTQRARIQYSRRGGRVNTDFIDNAAGVETSDREVNLKILLGLAIERDQLSTDERDNVLAAARDEVASAVLREVAISTRAVARAVRNSASDLEAFEALLMDLEAGGRLDRKVDALPDAEEFAMRRGAGAGLIRPELAVLHAAAKAQLVDAIEASPVAEDRDLASSAVAYFPASVASRFGHLVPDHQLHRQLVATAVGSEIVDRMGITWAHELADELDMSQSEVAAAYWFAREVCGADRRWQRVDLADGSWGADAENAVHTQIADLVGALARSYLRQSYRPRVPDDAAVFAELEAAAAESMAAAVEALVGEGVDRETALVVAPLARLFQVADVAAVARGAGRPVAHVQAGFARLDAELGLTAFELRLAGLVHQTEGRWERWQVRSLLDDTSDVRRDAVARSLLAEDAGTASEADAEAAVDAFLSERGGPRQRFDRLARQLDVRPGGEAISVATLATRALKSLLTS